MARDILQKKQRVAHNKVDDKNNEMFNENDFLPSFLEHIRRNDFSALHLNNLEPSVSGTNEAFVKQKTQINTIPISSQNSTSVPTSKKFRKSNKFPLMEKVARTVKQIKHNTHIPKPKAHLSTLSNLPLKLNSQSSNNNSISLNKSKEAEIARKDLKNINMQNENTEEFEIVNGLNKTGNDVSDSDDDLFENFIAKNRPENFKSVKNNSKKPQKSTKVAEKHISKSRSPARDFIVNDESASSESEYNMSGDEKLTSESDSNGSDDEKRASSESDSNVSDDETYVPSKQRNKNCKKTKKRREVLNNRQSTLKRKKASTSIAKKHNSRTFSKCASQESDSNASDDEKPASSESDSNVSDDETYVPYKQRNKNCKKSKKKHEVVNDRQSTSKRKNTSVSAEKTRNSRTFSKFTSQRRDSDISDESTCHYTRNKRIKNKVFDKKQSTKQDNASASIAKKRNSRTFLKSALQESDFDNSDDESSYYTRNKRMKKNNEMENRQSTSKVENDSDMINVNDSTYDTDSDLPPLAEIFTGLKSDIYASKSHEERDNLNNQESKFSSLDETCIASSVQFPVLHKTSDNKSMGVNQQSNALHKKSSLKTSLDNGQSNSKCSPTKNDSLSLGDDDQPNVLLKEESSIKTSLIHNGESNSKCFPTKNDSLPLVDNDRPYALLEEESSIKTSFEDNNQSNNACFTTKNGSVLGNSREKDFSKRPLVDLTESDNECENSFSIMPKITKISSQIANESESHSEESEIELLDVIVHELPEKNKTSYSSKKVGSNSSNDSIINPVNIDQILSCNNVKPQDTPKLQTLLNGKNEAAYSTGMCQDNDEKAKSKDMTVSKFNLNKDKPESSIESNALRTLISSNEVKKESHNDCEIVLDIASTNNSNQNLPVVQSCNNAIIKAKTDSKSVEEVAPIGVAKNDSIIKEQSNHSSIVSTTENSLSKNVKKEACNDDCQIVLDIASTNNSNQNLPGAQICNNLNIKSECTSKTIKEVTPIAVNTSCSVSKEQSIQSISNTEDSLISNKNIKKEPCDDCKIVLDIASTNKSNQNLPGLPDVCSKIKIENYSKVVDQVTPVHVANSGPIITEQNKLTQNEQKLHEVESSNSKNLIASHNETSESLEKEKMDELDSVKIKVLLERVKKELATYQEIIEAEETVQNAFKSLERRQAEKLMAIKSAIVECIGGTRSISECNSIKNAVSNLLDSSELHHSQVQDFKVFASINLVPLASIQEIDIKPSLPELQCALTQQPSTSARRNSIDHNWSFGQKCMVCAKDATSACRNCCKVFFCSDECGVKYWESGHKNACKYL